MVDRITAKVTLAEVVTVEVEACTAHHARQQIRRLLAMEYQGTKCTLKMHTAPMEVKAGVWKGAWIVNMSERLRLRWKPSASKPRGNPVSRPT